MVSMRSASMGTTCTTSTRPSAPSRLGTRAIQPSRPSTRSDPPSALVIQVTASSVMASRMTSVLSARPKAPKNRRARPSLSLIGRP